MRERNATVACPWAGARGRDRVICPELKEDGGTSHLSARVWQLDILRGIGYVNGSPHENVQVVHFGIFLFGDKVSKCIKEVSDAIRNSK